MIKYREAILYLVLILIISISMLIKINPVIVNLFNVERDIRTKTTEKKDLEVRLENIKRAELDKMNIAGQAKKIYKPEMGDLDAESSFTIIFDDIINMAKYNGVKIYSVEYVYNPPEDEFVKGAADKYNVCQLNMEIVSDYQDLENFLKEIYKYPYLVNINKLDITPYPKNKRILLALFQLRLYSSK